MKTNFASAAIAATYLAISAHAQNLPRFLDDTCEVDDIATYKNFYAERVEEGAFYAKSLWLKGLDERALCTDMDEIEIGHDNRAWVYSEDTDETTPIREPLQPNFLDGELSFDVDVSNLNCNCAAGVFLVALDGEQCKQGVYDSTIRPQCSTIDVMKANGEGFMTGSHDSRLVGSYCRGEQLGADEYGPGTAYTINTEEPYRVKTEFNADAASELNYVKTTLTQGARTAQMILECDFEQLGPHLNKNMAMAISNYSLDASNSTNPLSPQCAQACNQGSATISRLEWTEGQYDSDDSQEESDSDSEGDEGDDNRLLVWGALAPSLTSGLCEEVHNCTECRQSWYDDDLTNVEFRCKDETVYKYVNECKNNRLNKEGLNLCMTEDEYCHWSYPATDSLKGKSPEAACRTIPDDYIWGDWRFAKKPLKKQNAGLCGQDCQEMGGICKISWPKGEKKKNNPKTMPRCEVPN